jgi:alpha-L-fucosidase
MYGNAGIRRWHQEKFGADFGYKDFIPLFTAEKFNADEWAELFQKSGARYVTPSAQHHDNFALWDSDVTPFNSKDMGPKRDFIGELATAVRKRNMTYGVTNHGIENITFINPPKELLAEMKEKQTDLFDPKWATFYNVADRTDEGYKKFLIDWAMRNVELIEKYEPAVLWFDNGVDMRFIDPIKLWVAAYYYNRAHQRGQSVTIATKKAAYAPSDDNTKAIGSVMDFEKVGGRSPAGLRPGSWQVHDTIGSTWGYTEGMRISSPGSQIGKLVDTASKNGNYLLNVSPKGDGSIPEDQRNVLLAVGKWLETNGEAIYGTHAWTRFGDGRLNDKNGLRFTVKGDVLYAIVMNPQTGSQVTIPKLGAGTVSNALVLGTPGDVAFEQQGDSLVVTLPDELPTAHAAVVKIEGLTMNEPPITRSGNPEKFAP